MYDSERSGALFGLVIAAVVGEVLIITGIDQCSECVSTAKSRLGRVHTTRSASTMSANERNPRKRTSSFSKREKIRRNPLTVVRSRCVSYKPHDRSPTDAVCWTSAEPPVSFPDRELTGRFHCLRRRDRSASEDLPAWAPVLPCSIRRVIFQ